MSSVDTIGTIKTSVADMSDAEIMMSMRRLYAKMGNQACVIKRVMPDASSACPGNDRDAEPQKSALPLRVTTLLSHLEPAEAPSG